MPEEKKKVGKPLISLLILVVLFGAAGYLLKSSKKENTQAPSTEEVRTDGDEFEGLAVFPSWSTAEPATFPLIIDGEAKGTWFFEASFPLEIIAEDGTVLARGYSQAQESWMTEEVIPFYAEMKKVDGAPEYSGVAALVLKKANPSGLPEYDAQFTTQIFIDTTQ